MNLRHSYIKTFILTMIIFSTHLMACTMSSSEVASTAAADIELHATITENNTTDTTNIQAYITPVDNYTRIELDQGETISAQSEIESGSTPPQLLSESDLFHVLTIDAYYDVDIEPARDDGNYILTYKDKDGTETSVTLPRTNTVPITNLNDGDVFSQASLTITWDPALVTESLAIDIDYKTAANENKRFFTREVPNTGSYTIDSSAFTGSATITLNHEIQYNVVSDFGDTSLRMNNEWEVQVYFQ